MVLNLFLALLLNSFNSEELKTRKEVPTVTIVKYNRKEFESNLVYTFMNNIVLETIL